VTERRADASSTRTVLILGAGLVARPLVRYFLEQPDCRVVVAALAAADAEALVAGYPRGDARAVDVADPAQLDPLVRGADLVISLVPWEHHPRVARSAIRHAVDMVTASYVLPEMWALDGAAKAAGITILNEIGLDPGVDHMSALRLLDAARADGGRVTAFTSACGGLPAPEAADNPWRYKFSWSPRGVLLAGRQAARYLADGRVVEVPAEALFTHVLPYDVEGVGRFEIYPNRDSLRYVESYGLQEARTMLRATIRYPGWAETLRCVAALGLLDPEARAWPGTARIVDVAAARVPAGPQPVVERLARYLGVAPDSPPIERLRWAGLFSEESLPTTTGAPLDVVTSLLVKRLAYRERERDMVVLRHEIRVERDARPPERRISLLVAFGDPDGDSAMARTVSLPAAVAGRLLLDRAIRAPGVQLPTRPEIYGPVLERLVPFGIAFREWSEA
jgi:saccharopine dehydrogenase-like NADP-dependent oxidoreductase